MSFEIYYVQVRDKETGLEYPVPVDRYENASDLFDKLDDPPRDPANGTLLPTVPAKRRTSVSREAAKKATPKSGQKAATEEEKS